MTSRALVLAVFGAGALVAAQQSPSRQVEWPYYGGDAGGTKYSALTDINVQNVEQLKVAWQWKHWDTPLEGVRHDARVLRSHAADDRRRAARPSVSDTTPASPNDRTADRPALRGVRGD